MNMAILFAAASVLALTAPSAAPSSFSDQPALIPNGPNSNGTKVLYNQNSDYADDAIDSQNFEKKYAAYDD